MSEELHPYNDFFKRKLENHESSVPDDSFDNIMRKRAGNQPSDALYNDFFQKKLNNYESAAPSDLFDRLIREREGSDEQPSDAPLRTLILEHTTPVPPDVFDDLIVERERRRRALLWRFAAASLLFFAAYLWFLNKNTTSENLNTKTEKPTDMGNEKAQATQNIKNNADATTTSAQGSNKINYSENTEGGQLTQNAQPTTQNPQLKTQNSKSTTQNPKHTTQNTYTEGGVFVNKDKDLINNSLSSKQKKQSKNNSVSTTALTNLTHIDPNTANSQNTVSNSTNLITQHFALQQTIIPSIPTVVSSTAVVAETNNLPAEGEGALGVNHPLMSNAQSFPSDVQNQALNAQNPSFEHLSIFRIKNIAIPSRELKNPCAGPGDGCPSFGKKRSRGSSEKSIFIDVYGAPEYAFRRLSVNLPEMVTYLQARDSVEKSWYAFSAGARASLVFDNGLALRTGVVYAQTNEIATFDSLGIGRKDYSETYIPRLGGGQDTIRKTVIVSGIFRTTHYNRYRSFDIPLQLGFEFPLNDYWSFSVNGGANFNIASWRKADILGTNGSLQNVSSRLGEANPVFRNSLGISIFGSVAAYRQLTGNLQLVIEPSVRHYLQPITRSDNALNQAYTNAGLMLGLRYRL